MPRSDQSSEEDDSPYCDSTANELHLTNPNKLYLTPTKFDRPERSFPSTPSTCETSSSRSSNTPISIRAKPKPLPSFLNRKIFNSIGSSWTVEMCNLQQCGSYFEAVVCLRRIRDLLDEIDFSDRVKFCQADYARSTLQLKKRKLLWSDDLFREVISIEIDYFNQNMFQRIPTDVLLEIFRWLPICDCTPLFSVCSEWCETVSSDKLWRVFYHQKYLMNNPGAYPRDSFDMITSFRCRLNDPEIGDKIEVSWRGKFRLETQDVYQGLAWWVAEVVDKHDNVGRYKIRYPGWESRWDEWVPRSRLRWAVSENTIVKIDLNDVVELWCCGANVPGAWLESRVKRVRGGRYCIGGVLSSGHLWVERDRLRLVRRASEAGRNNSEVMDIMSQTWQGRANHFVGLFSTFPSRFLQGGAPSLDDEEIPPESACTIV